MSRPVALRASPEQVAAGILDATARLIAARGTKETSVQAVADATGYSKAGILKKFASKQALIDATIEHGIRIGADCLAEIGGVDYGPDRDAAALRTLTNRALSRRGWSRLALAAIIAEHDDELHRRLEPLGETLWAMFAAPGVAVDLDRRARVSGAFSAMVVLALISDGQASREQAEPLIFSTCWDTLGHPHRG